MSERMVRLCLVFWLALGASVPVAVHAAGAQTAADDFVVYIGTYTRADSKGIYAFRLGADGKLAALGLMAETANPPFLALDARERFLYSVGEITKPDGQKVGAVNAFAIDPATHKLTLINQVSARGAGPCFVGLDRAGKNVLVTNYTSGSVAVLPIRPDGGLTEASAFVQHSGASVNPERQQGPHAHSVNLSPDNRFAIVADLGLDELLVYRFDAEQGTLVPTDPPFARLAPGAGPRHFAFHPDGKHAFVINELSSTVTAFDYDARAGRFKELQTVTTLPQGFVGQNAPSEVAVHPSGKFLYGANRGHDSIAVFAIAADKGTLTPIEIVPCGGKVPRHFGIDPTGRHLIVANQGSSQIVHFRIDPKTGRLTPSGQVFDVSMPSCVKYARSHGK